MTITHLVIPPPNRDEADLIVTYDGDTMTVHEFDGHGFEAHTAVPRYFGHLDLWAQWSSEERSYFVDAED